ncbi:uncharacterized protein N7443_009571 [Penicillium atrosanguineum]|uniref:DUF5872 domain-containing protein n=1 Tax=Penicillium atrosanguineum TaxID=1132637 RepID=A0A9W9U112_9EURO|nr:uncharacterized protein N7443_009571 [Penicillium atrosanguineum]KAJ5138145.1 hypothetical protein N7526_004378 [Penicillium atrosanguineum]KAJ5289318.1 hypothetical protein N7443_009571 [Penicillium atrosanguineum]KAJ5307132.1 hypothetical protein N7476_007788 [Penicillium atrosanguineum]
MAPRDKYSDPKLRDEVKEEIHKGDKGGKPGQWSARKAQMMASEYKKRGGGYNTTKEEGQDESQKHLDQWTKEDWQTKEGSGTARKSDGSEKRYLPKKAWEQMNDDEKEKSEEKKIKGSEKGKQFVGNTPQAKKARKDASRETGGRDARNTRNTRSKKGSQKQGEKGHGFGSDDFADELIDGDDDKETGQQVAGTKRHAKQSNASVKKRKDDRQEPAEENGDGDEE